MRFLLLNQTFWPDIAASGQYLADVAITLVNQGHQVTVVTSQRDYNQPSKKFSRSETWRGVQIIRIPCTGFGKSARWRRSLDFLTFLLACTLRVLLLPPHDAVIALTSPPLISFVATLVARLWRCPFLYWVMDLNPDAAIAAGWLRHNALPARFLETLSRLSLRQAQKVIVLDRFMRDRLQAKDIRNVRIIPLWSQDDRVQFDLEARARFRRKHNLENKFVVMYAGNHSPVHPLDTVFGAMAQLADEPDVVFCFVGGGSEFPSAQNHVKSQAVGSRKDSVAANREPSPEILCIPYVPTEELAGMLSAADVHLMVMGEAMVGLVHPCKIYNLLRLGTPIVYVGPDQSHIADLFDLAQQTRGEDAPYFHVRPGDVPGLAALLRTLQRERTKMQHHCPPKLAKALGRESRLGEMVEVLTMRRGEQSRIWPTLVRPDLERLQNR